MHVELLVDGKKISLNDFVEEFFGKTLDGAISSLSGINDDWKERLKQIVKIIKATGKSVIVRLPPANIPKMIFDKAADIAKIPNIKPTISIGACTASLR